MNKQTINDGLLFWYILILCMSLLLCTFNAKAGSLEPTAPPGPTMKTLDEIPPTWSQKLDSTNGSTIELLEGCDSSRFKCIFYETIAGGFRVPRAVLDKETGLVWERSPSSQRTIWDDAYSGCIVSGVGNRLGWRLPTIHELSSLMDFTTSDYLPEGHPFTNSNGAYWTSTLQPASIRYAWGVAFSGSGAPIDLIPVDLDVSKWCVRGGNGHDPLK